MDSHAARTGIHGMAEVFASLMSELGYQRFAAQGGDWGAFIVPHLGCAYRERLSGIHLNFLAVPRDPALLRSEDEF